MTLEMFYAATGLIGIYFLIEAVRRRSSVGAARLAVIASGLGMVTIALAAPHQGSVAHLLTFVMLASAQFYTGAVALRARQAS